MIPVSHLGEIAFHLKMKHTSLQMLESGARRDLLEEGSERRCSFPTGASVFMNGGVGGGDWVRAHRRVGVRLRP